MTVLITGPTGAAGEYIMERVLTTDEKVRVLALPETLHRIRYRNQLEIIPGSLENEEAVLEAVRDVDTIYHAALLTSPPNRTPDEFHRVNVEGTRRLLEACAGDIKRFVLVSTNLVYTVHHTPDTWPVRADTERLRPGESHLTPYGQSMIDAEDFVFEASAAYGMEYAILRPTSICGRKSRFIERLLAWLMRDPQHAASRTHALFPAMQWVHGIDLARAAILAATRPEARDQIYIVAGNESVTAYSLLATIWELTHARGEPNPYAQVAAEHHPPLLKFDVEKIRAELGFEPEIKVRECLAELLGRYEFFNSSSLEMPRLQNALDFEAGIEEVPSLPNIMIDRIFEPTSIPTRLEFDAVIEGVPSLANSIEHRGDARRRHEGLRGAQDPGREDADGASA
jgi:UDP-glucose 4-epimerase